MCVCLPTQKAFKAHKFFSLAGARKNLPLREGINKGLFSKRLIKFYGFQYYYSSILAGGRWSMGVKSTQQSQRQRKEQDLCLSNVCVSRSAVRREQNARAQ